MERTATLLADLLGCPVSTGFVASCLTRLADADQLYHDETPVPVNGGTGYVYAARADGLFWYGAHEHRSHAATDGFGILPRFAARARPRRLGRLPQVQRPRPGREGDRGP